MHIVLNPNINLFKDKTKLEVVKLISKYKNYYNPILKHLITEVDIDDKYINSVSVVSDIETYGVTSYFIKDNNIYFDIAILDDVFISLKSMPDDEESYKAKAIFQHELFHCKEIRYLYENEILRKSSPLDDDFKITTTYNFLYDEAVRLWSEFYAFYYNRSINEWHEVPDIREDIEDINKWLLASKKLAMQEQYSEIRISKDMIKSLHTFWYNMIYLCAIHMQEGENILIDDFLTSNIPCIKPYFEIIYGYLKLNLSVYPSWLSEENYINFGKVLISIIKFYDLDFSTEDLSDNLTIKAVNKNKNE